MRLYDRYVLPRLLHVSMKNPEVRRQRARIVPAAAGRVLEIGIGSGLNLPHYGASVASVDGIDPSSALLGMAGNAVTQVRFPVTLHHGSAEELPFAQGAFDTVISTWTMCLIPDIGRALAEIPARPQAEWRACLHRTRPRTRARRCAMAGSVGPAVGTVRRGLPSQPRYRGARRGGRFPVPQAGRGISGEGAEIPDLAFRW